MQRIFMCEKSIFLYIDFSHVLFLIVVIVSPWYEFTFIYLKALSLLQTLFSPFRYHIIDFIGINPFCYKYHD